MEHVMHAFMVSYLWYHLLHHCLKRQQGRQSLLMLKTSLLDWSIKKKKKYDSDYSDITLKFKKI